MPSMHVTGGVAHGMRSEARHVSVGRQGRIGDKTWGLVGAHEKAPPGLTPAGPHFDSACTITAAEMGTCLFALPS